MLLPQIKKEKMEIAQQRSHDTASSKVAEHALAQFGLQLYTLRDDLPKDPKGVLKQVAGFGYKQIEGYEG